LRAASLEGEGADVCCRMRTYANTGVAGRIIEIQHINICMNICTYACIYVHIYTIYRYIPYTDIYICVHIYTERCGPHHQKVKELKYADVC
jgi:hypothetical protein